MEGYIIIVAQIMLFVNRVLFGFWDTTGVKLWKIYFDFGRFFIKINIDDKDERDKIVVEAWAKLNVEGRRRFDNII